ncbi:Ig-like domain-containing protein [Candidatus Microgenomates bacterium]|nr:Ig-like domain-containing protein [Candidatus Microgenomates bacterium]
MRTKNLIIILVLIISALIIFNLFVKKQQPIQIISTVPVNGAENVEVDASLKIYFNREPKIFSVISSPEIDYSTQINKTIAVLTLNQSLKPETKYSLTVISQEKEIYSLSFTTRAQTEAEIIEEEMAITKELYPLINFIPYETENFKIAYEAPLLLLVKMKKENNEKIKKEVLDWIRSKKVDPSTHKIEWVTSGF